MSNHSGSYIINEMLLLMNKYGAFTSWGKDTTLSFLDEVRKICCENDCNDGETLEEIGETLGVCYCCWDYGNNLEHGICDNCC